MSFGIVCLKCRQYLARCQCEQPLPSSDAKTQHDQGDLQRILREVYRKTAEQDVHLDQIIGLW